MNLKRERYYFLHPNGTSVFSVLVSSIQKVRQRLEDAGTHLYSGTFLYGVLLIFCTISCTVLVNSVTRDSGVMSGICANNQGVL